MNYLIILGWLTEWGKSMSILPLTFIACCFPGHKNYRGRKQGWQRERQGSQTGSSTELGEEKKSCRLRTTWRLHPGFHTPVSQLINEGQHSISTRYPILGLLGVLMFSLLSKTASFGWLESLRCFTSDVKGHLVALTPWWSSCSLEWSVNQNGLNLPVRLAFCWWKKHDNLIPLQHLQQQQLQLQHQQ